MYHPNVCRLFPAEVLQRAQELQAIAEKAGAPIPTRRALGAFVSMWSITLLLVMMEIHPFKVTFSKRMVPVLALCLPYAFRRQQSHTTMPGKTMFCTALSYVTVAQGIVALSSLLSRFEKKLFFNEDWLLDVGTPDAFLRQQSHTTILDKTMFCTALSYVTVALGIVLLSSLLSLFQKKVFFKEDWLFDVGVGCVSAGCFP